MVRKSLLSDCVSGGRKPLFLNKECPIKIMKNGMCNLRQLGKSGLYEHRLTCMGIG